MTQSFFFSGGRTMRTTSKTIAYEPWPELPYEKFAPTAYLLHRIIQVIGKLKLATPFEPQWSNVVLWLNSRGLTTGLIPYEMGAYSVELDLMRHQIICKTSWDQSAKFKLMPTSVAKLTDTLFKTLHDVGIKATVNLKPQEVPEPIPFNLDFETRPYDSLLANAWWRILVSSYLTMQLYHARFTGKTPPIGFMWGTFDLRDVRFNGTTVPTTGSNAGYIRRNAMDAAQIEVGWWYGSAAYPRGAYYSFTYPQPNGIEKAVILPKAAHWDTSMAEFILDYDDVRGSKDPAGDLLLFFESTYQAGATQAGWDPKLIGTGKAI